jgi:hypothetical protein
MELEARKGLCPVELMETKLARHPPNAGGLASVPRARLKNDGDEPPPPRLADAMRAEPFDPRRLIGAACLALFGAGCASPSTGVRVTAEPPELRYIPKEKLSSAMWQLADAVTKLNNTLHDEEGVPSDEKQQEVVDYLTTMAAVAASLEAPGRRSNHPMIDTHIDDFRRDVEAARRSAELNPPNYYLAGAVAGSCMYCHGK